MAAPPPSLPSERPPRLGTIYPLSSQPVSVYLPAAAPAIAGGGSGVDFSHRLKGLGVP